MADGAVRARPADNRVAPPSLLRRYGSQLGIIGVGLAMWLAFVSPRRRVFTDIDIYRAFAQTTPQFGIIALSLTFVVITGEIDLSFPSVMALGTAVFCLVTANGGAPWWVGADRRPSPPARLRLDQRRAGGGPQHPLARHHHRHAVPVPRPRAGADERHRRAADRRQISRNACAAARAVLGRFPVADAVDDRDPDRRCGSCSTARGSARMSSSSATTRPARG